jgi:hypothetical protein
MELQHDSEPSNLGTKLTSSMPLSAVVTAAFPLSCASMCGRITSMVAWGAMKINLCTCGLHVREGPAGERSVSGVWDQEWWW